MEKAIWALALVGLVACCTYQDVHAPKPSHNTSLDPLLNAEADYVRARYEIKIQKLRCKELGQCDGLKEAR